MGGCEGSPWAANPFPGQRQEGGLGPHLQSTLERTSWALTQRLRSSWSICSACCLSRAGQGSSGLSALPPPCDPRPAASPLSSVLFPPPAGDTDRIMYRLPQAGNRILLRGTSWLGAHRRQPSSPREGTHLTPAPLHGRCGGPPTHLVPASFTLYCSPTGPWPYV